MLYDTPQVTKTSLFKKNGRNRLFITATWTCNDQGEKTTQIIGYYDYKLKKPVGSSGWGQNKEMLAIIESEALRESK